MDRIPVSELFAQYAEQNNRTNSLANGEVTAKDTCTDCANICDCCGSTCLCMSICADCM